MNSSHSQRASELQANHSQFFLPLPGSGSEAAGPWRENFPEIVGNCPSLLQALESVAKVARTSSPVLILGESGTGKELIAAALHRLSPRANKRLVAINCSAIPEDLLEAELFGHEKGAFTGADRRRQGHFESAAGGTLFLDEIGEMPLRLQAKLLRVLQEKRYSPLGSDEVKLADVRIVAATNSNLDQAVLDKTFRLDLYYRLHVVPVLLPPLRDRGDDLPLLIHHFLDISNRVHSPEFPCHLAPETIHRLRSYGWPGNVRQLQNLIDRLVILQGQGGMVSPAALPPEMLTNSEKSSAPSVGLVTPSPVETRPAAPTPPHVLPESSGNIPSQGPSDRESQFFTLPDNGVDLIRLIENLENSLILQALDRTKNNKNQAARLLGLNRTTLVERIKKRGISALNRPSREAGDSTFDGEQD